MAVSPKIAHIIAGAYDKIGVLSLQIMRNYEKGYGQSKKQEELKSRLIKTTKLVRLLSKFVEFDDDGNFVAVHRLTDTAVNDHLKYLIKVADLDNLPTAPKIFYKGPPAIRVAGGPGPEGDEGPIGPTGGGTDFNVLNITTTGEVLDRFLLSEAKTARWDYFVYGSGGRRSGTLRCIWSDDGLTFSEVSDIGTDDIGTTIGNVSFTVQLDGSDIVLKIVKTSGTWNVRGIRYWIPGNGTYVPPVSGLLGNGEIYVGDINNNAVGVTPSGVMSMTNAGVFSYVAGSITNAAVSASAAIAYSKLNLTGGVVNADISASAAIVYSKLNLTGGVVNADINASAAIARTKIASGTAYRMVANDAAGALAEVAITANRAIVSDANGLPTAAATTATEIGYVNGVTSPLQAQINGKQAVITGAATSVTTSDLTPLRLLISDASGKIAVSAGGSGAGIPGGSVNDIQINGGGVFSSGGVALNAGVFSRTGSMLFSVTGSFSYLSSGAAAGGTAFAVDDTSNSAVTNVIGLTHSTSGVPALGIGVGITFTTETSAGNQELGSAIESVTTNITGGTETFDLVFKTLANGTDYLERLRIEPGVITAFGNVAMGNANNSGSERVLSAQGSLANINLTIQAKGTGVITLDSKTTVNSGITANGSGVKHGRFSTGSIAGSSTAVVTATWSTAFSDANYTVSVAVESTVLGNLRVLYIQSKTASAVELVVQNTNILAETGSLDLIAIHD